MRIVTSRWWRRVCTTGRKAGPGPMGGEKRTVLTRLLSRGYTRRCDGYEINVTFRRSWPYGWVPSDIPVTYEQQYPAPDSRTGIKVEYLGFTKGLKDTRMANGF